MFLTSVTPSLLRMPTNFTYQMARLQLLQNTMIVPISRIYVALSRSGLVSMTMHLLLPYLTFSQNGFTARFFLPAHPDDTRGSIMLPPRSLGLYGLKSCSIGNYILSITIIISQCFWEPIRIQGFPAFSK